MRVPYTLHLMGTVVVIKGLVPRVYALSDPIFVSFDLTILEPSLRWRVHMNIIIIMEFSNVISLLFLRSRGIKLKMQNCVFSELLCTKYEAPKISLDARSASL